MTYPIRREGLSSNEMTEFHEMVEFKRNRSISTNMIRVNESIEFSGMTEFNETNRVRTKWNWLNPNEMVELKRNRSNPKKVNWIECNDQSHSIDPIPTKWNRLNSIEMIEFKRNDRIRRKWSNGTRQWSNSNNQKRVCVPSPELSEILESIPYTGLIPNVRHSTAVISVPICCIDVCNLDRSFSSFHSNPIISWNPIISLNSINFASTRPFHRIQPFLQIPSFHLNSSISCGWNWINFINLHHSIHSYSSSSDPTSFIQLDQFHGIKSFLRIRSFRLNSTARPLRTNWYNYFVIHTIIIVKYCYYLL